MAVVIHVSQHDRFTDGLIVGAPGASNSVADGDVGAVDWLTILDLGVSGRDDQRLFTLTTAFTLEAALCEGALDPDEVVPVIVYVPEGAVVAYTGILAGGTTRVHVRRLT